MKFEEIAQAYRDGEDIEFLNELTGNRLQFRNDCTTSASIKTILTWEYRIKPKKVKRYQVLFYILYNRNNKLTPIYKTTDSLYMNEEDFYERFSVQSGQNFLFDKLILESEQEVDE